MTPSKILVFHTAFIGDVVLTLPLVQRLRASFPTAHITFVAIPSAANVLENHPAINNILIYDKRRRDSGFGGMFRLVRRLRDDAYDVAIIPHRSLRSALVGWLSRIPRRIGFSTSAATTLFTDIVLYDKRSHEIDRNLRLLQPLGLTHSGTELPTLYPSQNDRDVVDAFLTAQFLAASNHGRRREDVISIAPGSAWNTKRWLKEHFIALGKMLVKDGYSIVLVGGREDNVLCNDIKNGIGAGAVVNAAGMLTLLQSAELIRRCVALVSNDSAPVHLAAGVETPVVAIFGATAPAFGFAPRGAHDIVVETHGLMCRPCAIHGGRKCPIKTFACMTDLKPELVYSKVQTIIGGFGSEVQ